MLFSFPQILVRSEKEKQDTSDNYKRMTIEELQRWYDSAGVTAPTAKVKVPFS